MAGKIEMAEVPATPPVVVENHDAAYHIWRHAGVTGRTLVHVDAHHDMWWLDDASRLTIANYVCQAIKDGFVNHVIWVVPDAAWTSRRSRRALSRHLRSLAGQYSAGRPPIDVSPRRLSTDLRGTPVTICSLDSLPVQAEPVLLDLDTDFLVLPVVEYERDDTPAERPWIWPEELVAALRAREVQADIVTVAYSVEGGYTPLAWKHLGDALALEWVASSELQMPEREGYRCLRRAAVARASGDHGRAGGELEQASQCLPRSAAPFYHLALLHQDAGEIDDARGCFERAVGLDPSYRGPYSSRGFAYLFEGRFDAAASEFNRLLELDPENPFARVGMARLAMRSRQWPVAETQLRRSLAASPRLVDGHRSLGEVLAKLGREDEAITAYARSVRLALAGEVSVTEPILTAPDGAGPRDGGHGRVHAAMARLDARRGRMADAVAGYRMAIAVGYDRVGVRGGLAWLFMKQRRWHAAATEGARAIAQVPNAVRRVGRHILRNVRRAARKRHSGRKRPA